MTKQPIYILIFSLFFSILSSGQNDWSKLHLNANIKSLKQVNYNIIEHFGTIKTVDIIDGVNYTFNETGFLSSKENYGKNGIPINKHSFTYGNFNNILKHNITDKDEKLIKRITYEYNELYKPIVQNVYQFDGSLVSKSAYSYAKKNKLYQIITFDSGGEKKNLQEISYHKRKLTKLITTTNPKSKLKKSTKKYDQYDNLLESSVFDVMENLKTKITFKYNDMNNLTESRYFEGDKLSVQRNLIYNNLGFLIKETVVYPQIEKSDIITYTYEFDKKANWVKRIKHINSVPVKLEERTIVYY